MANPRYFEWLEPDKLILIQGWARDGLTEEQIAHNMGISTKTLYNWKQKKECLPILQALKSGKEVIDYIVENSLLKAAREGNVTAQIFWLKNRKPDKWRDKREPDVTEDALRFANDILVSIKNTAVEDGNSTD